MKTQKIRHSSIVPLNQPSKCKVVSQVVFASQVFEKLQCSIRAAVVNVFIPWFAVDFIRQQANILNFRSHDLKLILIRHASNFNPHQY